MDRRSWMSTVHGVTKSQTQLSDHFDFQECVCVCVCVGMYVCIHVCLCMDIRASVYVYPCLVVNN